MEVTPTKIDIIFTQTQLAQHCNVSLTTVKQWCKYGLGEDSAPKKGEYFSYEQIILLSQFIFATRYLGVYQYKYLNEVIPIGGIDKYLKWKFRISLPQYLDRYLTPQQKQGFWEHIFIASLSE
ncbi:MAG: hypothetical protein AAGG00_19550 [Cyanobacteria bacterium P01_H01_bin.150]